MSPNNRLPEPSDDSLLLAGEVVGFHGLRGEIKLKGEPANLEILSKAKNCTVALASGDRVTATIRTVREAKAGLVVSFGEYCDRTAAEALAGAKVFVKRSARKLEKNEWWEKDLVGLAVVTDKDAPVGTVSGIMYGPTTILEVVPSNPQGDKKILIPFVDALVPVVDIENKKIVVVDLPGLLEPQ